MKNANPVSALLRSLVLVAALMLTTGCGRSDATQTVAPKTVADFFTINVGYKPVKMQLAVRFSEMEHGLMGRTDLKADEGMLFVYIEPQQDEGRLTANTARTSLLIDGQPLPWTDWAAEIREKMPDKIAALMDKVAAGTSNVDNTNAIRERLKQIKDLFKFTRYRPKPDGSHTIDEEMANAGGKPKSGNGSGGGGSRGGGKHGGGGRAGDIYSLFADTGETPAEEVGGFPDPKVTWVSVANKTRTPDFLEDRAGKYLPETNTIQANADFRVFDDMVTRWCKFYDHVPNARTTVEAVAKEWFQQQLVETVLGALALRRSGNWSEQEIGQLWSEEALTSAVLPRYHVDQSIKRALGSKLGTIKDKDVA